MSSMERAVAVIFSKNRAMQLDATLRSLFLHGSGLTRMDVRVLYLASSPEHERQYQQLILAYPAVTFIREVQFQKQLMTAIQGYPLLLFLVDDAIFVRQFPFSQIAGTLRQHPDALGFILGLGTNTSYSYTLNRVQELPAFQTVEHGFLKYRWAKAKHDFGYPLQVSASLYRADDLLPLLGSLSFANPNTLELGMARHAKQYRNSRPSLLIPPQTISFCAPMNRVQHVFPNRAGSQHAYPTDKLRELFDQGYRIDVAALSGFVPNAIHQEVALRFLR